MVLGLLIKSSKGWNQVPEFERCKFRLKDCRKSHESGGHENHQTGNEKPAERIETVGSIASIPGARVHARTVFTLISRPLNVCAVVV